MIAMQSVLTPVMITRRDCDSPHSSGKAFRTDTRQDVASGCPGLKKARYSWQVKNSLAVSEKGTDSINNDRLNESSSSDPATTCLDNLVIKNNDCKDNENVCFDQEGNSSNSGAITDGAFGENRPSDGHLLCRSSFPQDLQNKENIGASPVTIFPQFFTSCYSERRSELCVDATMRNEAAPSGGPSDVLQTVANSVGNWMLEYSLMRAKLDNDINQALEDLRHLADRATQRMQPTYVSQRISLETAGIIQVIEQKGLKACPQLFPLDTFSGFQRIESSPSSGLVTGEEEMILTKTGSEETSHHACTTFPNQQRSPEMHCSDSNSSSAFLSPPGSSFIIDKAVSTAIFERGVHL